MGKKYIHIFQIIKIVRKITGHFTLLGSIFNWQILTNFVIHHWSSLTLTRATS